MIISKQYAHLTTITKIPVNFQRYQHKTVGGVAYTRHLFTLVGKMIKYRHKSVGGVAYTRHLVSFHFGRKK